MKKLLCFILSVLFVIMSMPFSVFAAENGEKSTRYVYVDAGVEQSGNGTKEKPYKTIKEAKDYVRTLDKTAGDITVEIANGEYFIDNTLTFDKRDSGTKDCEIKYVAQKGASPVISGGKAVTGQWSDEGNGIFSIELNRDEKLRSLYVNGERCYMTSKVVKAWGGYGEYSLEENSSDAIWVSGTETAGVLFPVTELSKDTKNPSDIELMTQTRWNTTIVCVDTLENKGAFTGARLQQPYGAIAQTLGWGNEYQFFDNNMVFNVFEWLDEPGEFYFDREGQRLYYFPRENEDLTTAQVVVPQTETLIDIQGENLENHVSNLSFEGLTFAYTDWNLFNVDGSCGRATNQGAACLTAYAPEDWHGYIYRAYDVGPGAVQISSADNITFTGNQVCHTGNDGISIVNDAENITLNGNSVYDTAGATLLIGHPQHEYIGDKGSDKGKFSHREKYDVSQEGACKNIAVTNNLFKDTSRLFWGVAGVMVYMTENMLFQYNQVENTPYSGISLGWGWWNMNGSDEAVVPGEPSTTMHDNKIINNRFINTITTLSDAGAIYTIGDMPGTIISENYIKKIGAAYSQAYHIRGIHIDEGTQNVYGEKNVIDIDPQFTCIDCGDWGNKGNNTWDNNYSTSSSYTTTETYEPGTVITNAHTVEDGQWDETATQVIENSGIQSEYKALIPAKLLEETPTVIETIPAYNYIPMIVCLSVAGVVILALIVTAVVLKIKKHKKLKKESSI